MEFNIPTENNKKLEKLIENIKNSKELENLLKMCNISAIDRMRINDHGPTHVKIVANSALKILRILSKETEFNIVKNYKMTNEDAEVIVVLGAVLHDIGHAIHRHGHEQTGLIIAKDLIIDLLSGIYDGIELQTMQYEILHVVYSHEPNVTPLTIEAGVVKVADALDMQKGRGRIPYQIGSISIHSVSVMAVEEVIIDEGKERPLKIIIKMSDHAGIFQVDDLLKEKIATSGIKGMLTVDAIFLKDGKEELIKEFRL